MHIFYSDKLTLTSPPDLEAFSDWLFYGFCIAGVGFTLFYFINLISDKRRHVSD